MRIKLTCLLIFVAVMLCTMTACFGNTNEEADEYFIYSQRDDGTWSIRARNIENLPDELVIPDTYNDVAVTEIEDEGFMRASVRSVKLGRNIKYVSNSAFAMCTKLVSVDLHNSVEGFGNGAFGYCESLVEMNYIGTKIEWNSMVNASNWNVLGLNETSRTIVVKCSDGTVEEQAKDWR